MFAQKKLHTLVDKIRNEHALPLRIELWNGQQFDFGGGAPQVTVRVPQASALAYLLRPTLDSLGAAYVEGKIEVLGKAAEMVKIVNALAAHSLPSRKNGWHIGLARRRNRKAEAEAIRYHYDVSNEFYAQWLDPNMVYSCAYFENGDESLEQAQIKKIDHILKKIALQPGQRLLDIGCGWGALVIRAAQQFGAHCVGVTLSEQQYLYAKNKVEQAGLSHLIEIRLQDYRDIDGTFDRITSVGMFEHVGLRNLPVYFEKIHDLLAEGGMAMNHGITSTDPDDGDSPYGGGTFIDRYVFPHGEVPHISRVLKTMQDGGLETLDVENLRQHYAKTCGIWADNFEKRADQIRPLTDAKHFRIWQVYLAGCSYAFEKDHIAIFQVLCTRSGRDARTLPRSRRYMYPKPALEAV
jgi:cyclopropane-fatty-acyl-phospholipid synthase